MAADVVISEFLASNSGGLRDGDGDSSDWIELFNTTSAPLDLSGFFLTDNSANLSKWAFPAGTTIGSAATLLVFASDKAASPPAGELHTNFKLAAGGEYLALVRPDGTTIVDSFAPNFPPQATNISYGLSMSSMTTTLVDDASTMRYWPPTFASADAVWMTPAFNDASWSLGTPGIGYEQNPGSSGDFTSYLDTVVPAGTTSVYARFAFHVGDPAAFSSLRLQMLYDDGFVAYINGLRVASANAPVSPAWNSQAVGTNRADEQVLSDYVDFDVTSHVSALAAGANVLAIHALNFAGSSDMLMSPKLVATTAQVDEPIAYGSFAAPTPDAVNGQAFVGVVDDTKFSVDRGFFTAPFLVDVTTATDGALIVYTTDGSEPTVDASMNVTNGLVYTGPLTIDKTTTLRAAAFKSGFIPTNVDTQTYIFLSDVIQQTRQSALAAGFPSTWGSRPSDYGLDPDVIGPNDLFGEVYAAQIVQSLTAIPSVSLTLNQADMFGPSGIYANPTGEGVAWERPVSAELIYPDGTAGFQIDAGLRIAGAASRVLSLKNGLRLLFKSEYGAGKLDFPLFGAGVDQFDTVVLRPHFNDGWGWDGALGDPLYARDQWFRDTQAAMGQPSSRGNLVHLYVNGLYWGLYNPSERPDASYSAETFGGDKSEYDVMVADGVHDGTGAAYATMISLAQAVVAASGTTAKWAAYQHLQGNLPTGLDNPAAEDYLDVENYIDYMILNHYGGNNDWPNRNWYATRRRGAASEGFKFIAWDSEISLALSSRTSINENNLGHSTGATEAYGILRNYDEFRLQFADRIHKHLYNGGALYVNPASPAYNSAQPENNVAAARFAALADRVSLPVIAESARWGDQHVTIPRTRDVDWQNSLNYVLGTYFTNRHGIVLSQWRSVGLYPTTEAPEFLVGGLRQHGGTLSPQTSVGFQNPNVATPGVVYYTTDGSDPRLVGGAVSGSAQVFSGTFSLAQSAEVKARILRGSVWSALTEARFVVPNADFDGNATIDGADFLAWQRGFGASNATPSAGDADENGLVDAQDLEAWNNQFGLSAPGAFVQHASSAVESFTAFNALEGAPFLAAADATADHSVERGAASRPEPMIQAQSSRRGQESRTASTASELKAPVQVRAMRSSPVIDAAFDDWECHDWGFAKTQLSSLRD
ncbi:MAG: chitobiase/beta-hexosaminidase C-terminal domain-containing protein [Pirellulales bacterium]|nr:chitobiase/beta-hexosaminidase C-terminal domain-containing protein [Pirellulales bacterium]